MITRHIFGAILISVIMLGSCRYDRYVVEPSAPDEEEEEELGPLTFRKDIQPLFTEKCGSCHNESGQIDFSFYPNAKAMINSILTRVKKMPGDDGYMPMDFPPLTQAEIKRIEKWNTGGLTE